MVALCPVHSCRIGILHVCPLLDHGGGPSQTLDKYRRKLLNTWEHWRIPDDSGEWGAVTSRVRSKTGWFRSNETQGSG
jgi:hypothetical protein